MRSAKPNISRGHELLERRPSPGVALVASSPAAVQPKPAEALPESPDYRRVHGRLPPRPAPPGPSLMGRMLGWRFVALSLAVGLAFSYWTQPRETLNYLDGALRLLGA